MIINIAILLLVNTFLPLLPIPPHLISLVPAAQVITRQSTMYDHLNLTRIHTPEQFKKAFRDSIKILHPDRGGDQETFQKVKSLKNIMEQQNHYYDTLNITDADMQYSQRIKDVVDIKETVYRVEAGIYYFIVFLYSLAFTIQDDSRPARKILIPLICLTALYEYFIHFYSEYPTPLDFISGTIPIFIQQSILKTALSSAVAFVRTKQMRKSNVEKDCLEKLAVKSSTEQKIGALKELEKYFNEKAVRKYKQSQSWGTKIKGWISKGISVLLLLLLVKGMIGF